MNASFRQSRFFQALKNIFTLLLVGMFLSTFGCQASLIKDENGKQISSAGLLNEKTLSRKDKKFLEQVANDPFPSAPQQGILPGAR